MPEYTALWGNGPRFAQTEHFKLGTDSVLLADFARTSAAGKGIDLGCGSGAIMLLLLTENQKLHMTGLELLPEAAGVAGENMRENALTERSRILCGDIRSHRALFPAGSFDLAVSNPPYFPGGRGFVSPKSGRAEARGELQCTLQELCTAAAYLLHTGGRFALVYRPERLSELFCVLSENGLEPKRLRMVCHRAQSAPSLVLVEARRGGKPGLKLEASLLLTDENGSESAEYRRIYHR